MRKNILWLNRLFLLFLSEKDEQKRADEQHIRIEQLRHDFKCVDGFAQTGISTRNTFSPTMPPISTRI